MPIAAFRAWAGFAKPSSFGRLTASISASGTSLTVSATVAASSTIYIIDGVNSETVTTTAGGSPGAITISAAANAHTANTPYFVQLTSAVGPAYWMPVTNLDAEDKIAAIEDKGLRGSNVSVYNVVSSAAHSELQIDGPVFPDVFGFVLGSIYGAIQESGSGAPWTHIFGGQNAATSNGQPTQLLLFVYNGFNVRLYAGAKCSEVNIKFDPASNLEYTSKWMAFESSVVTTGAWAGTGTPTFSTLAPQGGWQAQASINSAVVNNVLTADFTIKRDTMEAVQTESGTQSPIVIWSGPLSTMGNMTLTYEDDTNLNFYLNYTPIPVTFDLTNGASTTLVEVKLQMTKCLFIDSWKETLPGSKGYVEIGGPVSAVANTTDAVTGTDPASSGGGYSPSRVTLQNAVGTGVYQ